MSVPKSLRTPNHTDPNKDGFEIMHRMFNLRKNITVFLLKDFGLKNIR